MTGVCLAGHPHRKAVERPSRSPAAYSSHQLTESSSRAVCIRPEYSTSRISTSLPLSLDAVFAAGLIAHLPHPAEDLRELARAGCPGGAAGAFRTNLRAEADLGPLPTGDGWRMTPYVARTPGFWRRPADSHDLRGHPCAENLTARALFCRRSSNSTLDGTR